MPTFRIVVQTNISPAAASRAQRASTTGGVKVLTVEAATLVNAVTSLEASYAGHEQPPRIVSVEELLTLDAISDDALVSALTRGENPLDLDEDDTVLLFDELEHLVARIEEVARELRDTGSVPGLSVSILRDDIGAPDYVMVEIYDEATGSYRSVGREPSNLIGDRTLAGRAATLSVARCLIETVTSEGLL